MWSVLLSAAGMLLKSVLTYFSAEAELARRKVQDARDTARQEVEAERLQSTYERINRETPPLPDSPGMRERLNERFRK